MRERAHSASSLKTFAQCEYKYALRYEEGASPLLNDMGYLEFGTAVHKGLEVLYNIWFENQDTVGFSFSADDVAKIHDAFIKECVKGNIIDQRLIREGLDMLNAKISKFDFSEKVLGLEKEFSLVTPNGTKFQGHIDKVVELDDDCIAVIDYKTSRVALSQEEADNDIQLSMYDLAASILWPKYSNIILILDYLRLTPVMSHRTKSEREMFFKLLDYTNSKITQTKKESIKPRLNVFCSSCEYRYMCPVFKNIEEHIADSGVMIAGSTDEDAIVTWEKVDKLSKIVNSMKRDISMQVDDIIRKRDGEPIVGHNKKIVKQQSTRVNFSVDDVKGLIPEKDLINMCSINKTSLDKYISNNPNVASKIQSVGLVNYNKPSFRIVSKDK